MLMAWGRVFNPNYVMRDLYFSKAFITYPEIEYIKTSNSAFSIFP